MIEEGFFMMNVSACASVSDVGVFLFCSHVCTCAGGYFLLFLFYFFYISDSLKVKGTLQISPGAFSCTTSHPIQAPGVMQTHTLTRCASVSLYVHLSTHTWERGGDYYAI